MWREITRCTPGNAREFKHITRGIENAINQHFTHAIFERQGATEQACKKRHTWSRRSLEWEDSIAKESHLLRESTIIYSTEGEVLLAYNTHAFDKGTTQNITASLQKFVKNAKLPPGSKKRHEIDPSAQPTRFKSGAFYPALWHTLGHHNKGVRVSRGTISTVTNFMATSELFDSLSRSNILLSAFLCATSPALWLQHHRAMTQLSDSVGNLAAGIRMGNTDVFSGRAIVANLPTRNHQDDNDRGLAALYSVGSYGVGEGELVIPDLNIRLPYRPGHAVLFKAGEMVHFVTSYAPDKERIAVVNYMHNSVYRASYTDEDDNAAP